MTTSTPLEQALTVPQCNFLISSRRTILPTLLFAIMTQACPQWITSLLTEAMKERPDFPGLQLAVSSPYLECKTSITNQTETPLLPDTPWRIASITKTFTAVAAAKLAEKGVIDLNVPIVEYLPEWAIALLRQTISSADEITTWMLIHHTSGLGHHTDEKFMKEVKSNPNRHWTFQDILKWAVHYPTVTPGEFHYSDTGYTYLGLIAEEKGGLPATVRSLYELPNTYWEMLERDGDRAAQFLADQDVTRWEPSFDLYGAGGMVSNSEDLNRFTRALHTGQIIDTKVLYHTESTGFYGCGVYKMTFAGHEAWGHTGFWGSWTYYIASLDLVFSGTNNQGVKPAFDIEKLVKAIIEHYPEAVRGKEL